MFLIIPEGPMPAKEIIESGINIVTYNLAVENIREVSKKVIQQEEGWVTKIEHKDFEAHTYVFIEEDGKAALVDDFNFFYPYA